MDERTTRHLESALRAHSGRSVRVGVLDDSTLRVVLDPTGDRGRVDVLATGADSRWTVSDRGATGALHGLDLDFVISKLAAFDTQLTRRGDELVADTDDRSLAEAVAAFVDTLEFVPVLVGLYANDLAA
ncbi:MAG: hypothetical protein ABJH68_11945 [Ilumatobacter sp.]|uniref:hypothetical protein n=1 Tax=Ilumatobacter sp. TaxID=1967498 RepID=UPI003297C4E3